MNPDNYFPQRRPRLPDFEAPQRPQMEWMPPPPESTTDTSGLGTFLGQAVRGGPSRGDTPEVPPVSLPPPNISVPEPPLPEPNITLPTSPASQIRPRRRFPAPY